MLDPLGTRYEAPALAAATIPQTELQNALLHRHVGRDGRCGRAHGGERAIAEHPLRRRFVETL